MFLQERAHHYLFHLFFRWGGYVGSNPWKGIGLGFLIAIAACGGLNFLVVDNGNDLFIPASTRV